jgi:3-hydroxyacyl-CoA dehydrogenase
MHLVELIATQGPPTRRCSTISSPGWCHVSARESCAHSTRPNFVANRVGVFSILAVMHHTQRLGLGFDVVDSLTGPIIGRPKSATYRTADVVGLDTLAHVIKTMQDTLPARSLGRPLPRAGLAGGADRQGRAGTEDPRRHLPQGRQGDQGSRPCPAGLSRYRWLTSMPAVLAILKQRDPAESASPNCAPVSIRRRSFCGRSSATSFHYTAFHLADIADNARDVDFAMRWGFRLGTGSVRELAGSRLAGDRRGRARRTSKPAGR